MQILIIIFALLVTACQIPGKEVNTSSEDMNKIRYQNEVLDYEILFPSIITDSGSWLDSVTNDSGPFFGSKVDRSIDSLINQRDINIRIYNNIANCPPMLIGISLPALEEQRGDGYRMWGDVDQKDDGSYPAPNCRVKSVYPEKNPQEHMTAHAFCSQKNGKTVLICISQITDNPGLAEEIFRTFRWVD